MKIKNLGALITPLLFLITILFMSYNNTKVIHTYEGVITKKINKVKGNNRQYMLELKNDSSQYELEVSEIVYNNSKINTSKTIILEGSGADGLFFFGILLSIATGIIFLVWIIDRLD